MVEKLLETADNAVGDAGDIGQQATKPGGSVSELTSGLGDTLSDLADKANPKKLLGSGNGSSGGGGGSRSASSNGSGTVKAAITAGAAGAAGLAGAALLGRRKQGPFQGKSALDKLLP
ncbi:MAG TPA: hypothetical protein VGF25_07285 [Thermoleophilaceae bacterium]